MAGPFVLPDYYFLRRPDPDAGIVLSPTDQHRLLGDGPCDPGRELFERLTDPFEGDGSRAVTWARVWDAIVAHRVGPSTDASTTSMAAHFNHAISLATDRADTVAELEVCDFDSGLFLLTNAYERDYCGHAGEVWAWFYISWFAGILGADVRDIWPRP